MPCTLESQTAAHSESVRASSQASAGKRYALARKGVINGGSTPYDALGAMPRDFPGLTTSPAASQFRHVALFIS